MKTVASIKSVLLEQIGGYRMLLEVLQRERECLISFNSAGVETISKEKDTIVLRLRLLEEERTRLVIKFTAENGIKGDLSLQKFYELTGDVSFKTLRLQLISLLQGIAELNDFNRILIERSMNFIKNATGFLDVFGLNLNSKDTGAILSKEV
jgi:flagellar biosynthesis/type III secretory pathway chaperone